MSLGSARRQKSPQGELPLGHRGEAPKDQRSGEARTAASETGHPGDGHLMERVVERGNVKAALKRVRQNKGSPGIDGMHVEELGPWLVDNWEAEKAVEDAHKKVVEIYARWPEG